MNIIGLVTLGRDSELKHTNTGTAILEINGAYNVGYGQNKETQWIRGALFGKKAESLQQYLVKGTKIEIVGNDLKVNTYQENDGTTGVSLECKIQDVDFAGGGQSQGQQNQTAQPQQQPQQQYVQNGQPMNPQQVQNQQANGFQQPQQGFTPAPNDFQSDNIPF